MHTVVWEFYNGKVPKGHHVHHIDGDKSDNSIENLELMTASEHTSSHWTDEKRELARKHAEKIRPMTKKWHASKEGHKWHVEHGIETLGNIEPFERKCIYCSKKYITKTYHQNFCSNKCKSADRRKRGVDNVEKICEFCKKTFKSCKYKKSTCCSSVCGKRLLRKKDP
jgi:hypothetical protein